MTLDIDHLRGLPGWPEFLRHVRIILEETMHIPHDLVGVLNSAFCDAHPSFINNDQKRAEVFSYVIHVAHSLSAYPDSRTHHDPASLLPLMSTNDQFTNHSIQVVRHLCITSLSLQGYQFNSSHQFNIFCHIYKVHTIPTTT